MSDPDLLFRLFDGNSMRVEIDEQFVPVNEPPLTHELIRHEWSDEHNAMYGRYALPSTADGPTFVNDRDPKWILMRKAVKRWRLVSDWQDGEPPQDSRYE